MRRLACVLVLFLASAPCFAQGNVQNQGDSDKVRELRSPEVQFLDSEDAYWVTRSYNDILFYGAPGSQNAVRLEREQFRSEALSGIYKPAQIVEIKVNGKVVNSSIPTLKMGGKEVELKKD